MLPEDRFGAAWQSLDGDGALAESYAYSVIKSSVQSFDAATAGAVSAWTTATDLVSLNTQLHQEHVGGDDGDGEGGWGFDLDLDLE